MIEFECLERIVLLDRIRNSNILLKILSDIEKELGRMNELNSYNNTVKINASEILNKNGIMCDINSKLLLRDYYNELCMSKYILAPRGRGRDTFRVWEALSCKTVPIMLQSEYNYADFDKYNDLPILWVQSWNQINPYFLDSKIFNFNTSLYNKKIKPSFWKNMVTQY